jgi:hypothetical protein
MIGKTMKDRTELVRLEKAFRAFVFAEAFGIEAIGLPSCRLTGMHA